MERRPTQQPRLVDQNLAQDAAKTPRFENKYISALQRASRSKTARYGSLAGIILSAAGGLAHAIDPAQTEGSNLPRHELSLTGDQLEGTVFNPKIIDSLIDSRTQKPLNFGHETNLPQTTNEEPEQKLESSFTGPSVISQGEGISQAFKRGIAEHYGVELTPQQSLEGAVALYQDNNRTGDINLVFAGESFAWGEKALSVLSELGLNNDSPADSQAENQTNNSQQTTEQNTEQTNNTQNLVSSQETRSTLQGAGTDSGSGEGDLPPDNGDSGPTPGHEEGDLPPDNGDIGPTPGPGEGDLPSEPPLPGEPTDIPPAPITPHPTEIPPAEVTPHPTEIPPASVTPHGTATATNTPSPTLTSTATKTPTPPATNTPTATATPTATSTGTPENTPTNTPTATSTETPVTKATKTPTPRPTSTTVKSPTPSKAREIIPSGLPPTGTRLEAENSAKFSLLAAIFLAIFGAFLLPLGLFINTKSSIERGGESR